MQVLTIAHPSELAKAVALATSLREFNPDWPVTILVVAAELTPLPIATAGITVLSPAELGIELEERLTMVLDQEQLLQALRGPALAAMLRSYEKLVFLDPSLRVVGPLAAIEPALEQREIVLVPYLTADATETVPGVDIRSHGVFHPGILALRSGDNSSALLGAWPASQLAATREAKTAERTAFQAWFDTVAVKFQSVQPLNQPRFLAGQWNLANTEATNGATGLKVDDATIGLIDFKDFDPARPHLLSIEHSGPPLSALPAIAAIAATHASELIAQASALPATVDPYTRLPDGTVLDLCMRRLAGEAYDGGALHHSIFTQAGMEEFYAWLNAPADHGAFAGLTRYHEAIWNDRSHLRAAYPHLDGPDAVGYAGWLWVHVPVETPMPAALLPPEPVHVQVDPSAAQSQPPWGVNVAGFFSAELGLGEAARLLIGALDAANVPALPVQGTLTPPCRQGSDFVFADPDHAPFPINIVCMNGDTIPMFARDAGQHFFDNRYSIALWWWEVGEFPAEWHAAFDYLDEIWVASDHIYEVVAAVSPIPVFKVPMPVIVPRIVPYSRAALGMPEDDFVFLFVYDYHSTSARKNPVGLVNAFKQAFPPGSGASLVLKCINAERMPEHHEEVLVAIAGHPDIHIVDKYVSAAEKDAIIADCDCYVSLHRSEGFGLTPAEAMWLAKPVIATRYGGTLEFMTPENSYLVDYELAAVGDHAHPYPADASWAEPNLQQAAQLMRHVFDNQAEATARGLRAYDDIRATNAPLVAGLAMEKRLEVIFGNLANDPKYSLNPVRRDVRWKHPGDTKGGGAVARLKRLVKLVLFRIDRVSLRRQRAIDASTTSIERQLAAAKAESLSEFRRLRSELGDLRRQVAAAELALSTSASAPTSVEMPADAQNIDQQPPTNGGDPQASQPAPSADTA